MFTVQRSYHAVTFPWLVIGPEGWPVASWVTHAAAIADAAHRNRRLARRACQENQS
jgi:hypothetical protein